MEEKKKTYYYKETQAKYRDKVKQYNVKYSLAESDLIIVANIEKAIANTNMSANAWIKQAIKEKLINDGYIKN